MSLAERSVNLLSRLDLSPEERLLLLCARLKLDDSQRDDLVELVQGGPCWDQVLYKAHWHQLSPLMYHHLRDLDAEPGVPDWIIEQLEATYQRNAVRNLHFHGELQTVLNALEAGEVPVILLKGAALYPVDLKKEGGIAEVANCLIQEEITIHFSIPSAFRHLITALAGRAELLKLRIIHLGGEEVHEQDVEL